MNRVIKTILVIVLAGITLSFSVATILAPKKDFSENENRVLEPAPEFSVENVKDGSFMSNTETYVSDHFIFRDYFMTVRTLYELATGRNRINNIYMCKDGYYIEEYDGLQNSDRIISAVKRLMERTTQTRGRAVLAPTAVTVYAEKLPATAKNADQEADRLAVENTTQAYADSLSEGDFAWVDITDALKNAGDEQLFYKLDHHWTTYGAYVAYCEIIKSFGFEPLSREQFKEETVSTEFRGTFASKVNDLTAKPDVVKAFLSDRLSLSVKYSDKKLETDTLYAPEYLSKKDKYSYFLNNQNTFVEIHNANAQTEKVLAVIKDSYANCMIPFLCEHFETIYVFDTRYYRGKVTDFIAENGVTDVLFLYNMHTIDNDPGVAMIR